MSSENRLDRLEKIVRLVVKEGLRERKEMRDRINALISAQMRHEEAYAQFKHNTDEAMTDLARAQANTQEVLAQFMRRTEESMTHFSHRTDEEMARLTRAQANTDEKLNAFIGAVEKLVDERREGRP